ncbi:hypothetical protein MUN78_04910 [Leucobacter allii]|uniref:SbsA Ig-like domain-containing protein n=1 Tax=Leucobacter allii TaxID=2932247 RepID=A0ABY4FPH7_9MICO|nr:hypothetical protein [Leucobacter allii]UOQ58189.1 hypothetical protein MUN78_04910 [Leucobacter allii]
MCTERGGGERGRSRGRRSVVRAAAVALLALLALGLAAANLAQGPRLRTAEVHPGLVVSRTDQRLVLRLNQPLEALAPGDVDVSPDAPFVLSTEGSDVTIRFTGMLATDTRYTVEALVRSAALGTTRTVGTAFTTADPPVTTLVGGERILEHRLGDPAATRTVLDAATLPGAPAIREFAASGDRLAVVTDALPTGGAVEPSGRTAPGSELRLVTVPARDGEAHGMSDPDAAGATAPGAAPRLPLIALDRLEQLRADPRGGLIGVVGSGTGTDGVARDRTLFLIDAAPGVDAPAVTALADADGTPLVVDDWRFVPGTGAVVVRDGSGRILLSESFPEARVTDLGLAGPGRAPELGALLPGGTALAVLDAAGGDARILELSGARTGDVRLPLPETSALVPSGAPAGGALHLDAGTVVDVVAASDGSERIELRTAAGSRTLYAPAAKDTRIGRICLSPNGERLAVERLPAQGGEASTSFLAIDGEAAAPRSVIGGAPSWCA